MDDDLIATMGHKIIAHRSSDHRRLWAAMVLQKLVGYIGLSSRPFRTDVDTNDSRSYVCTH
jgi:hypothetical protein